MTILFALVRAVHFTSLMTIFGSEVLRHLFHARLEEPPAGGLPRSLLLGAALAAFVTALLWLVLAANLMSGEDSGIFDTRTIWLAASATFFGHVMLVRLALLAMLIVAFCAPTPAFVRAALSGMALSAIALTSHATSSGGEAWMLARAANDAAHLLAAGFWIGGLCYLVALVVAHRGALAALLPSLRLFSRWGTCAVAVLVAAGALNTWLILFASNPNRSLVYMGLLTAKIVLAALMVSLALVNRFSLVPGIRAGDSEAQQTLAPSVIAELAIGIVVVSIVGLLGLLPPSSS